MGASTPLIALDEHADCSRIQVALAESFVLRLDENPTTGYRWRLEATGAPVIALDGDSFEPVGRSTQGGPGKHMWRFRSVSAGEGTIQLSYRRPATTAAARTFTLTVQTA